MYQPPHHREDRLEVLHGLIRRHPLGLLISNGADGPVANPLPFLLDAAAGSKGVLRAHCSRANPQWKELEANPDGTVLVVFQGAETYISPSWYETKKETGKVVPTWNYVVVQARGKAEIVKDAEWLAGQIAELTSTHEAKRAEPWAVSDAPEPFVEAQIRGIVGIRIEIAEIEGKWKVSQNLPEADRTGVVDGLNAGGLSEMAELVRKGGR